LFEDHTRLSHWILDGDASHANLLNFALTETNYEDTTVLLCVSMTNPWNIMDQLQNWASLLQVFPAITRKDCQNYEEILDVFKLSRSFFSPWSGAVGSVV
jgi:hypothetical protein